MIANALKRLLAEAERANETWLKEAGHGLIDVSAINEARTALSASSDHFMVAAIDAAMVEMRNISPPLRRSECERLIRAALGGTQQATQPAEVTLPHLWPVIRWLKNGCDVADAITELELYERHIEKARAILALRPVQVPMTPTERERELDRSPVDASWEAGDAFMEGIYAAEAHHGISAQAKKGDE